MLDFYPTLYPAGYYYQEFWSPIDNIVDYPVEPNRFLISSYGRFYDKRLNQMRPTENVNKESYTFADLKDKDNKILKHMAIHILVARAFIPLKYEGQNEVNHIDGVPYHNWVWNLEWTTHQENLLHAVGIGLYKIGEEQQNAIFTDSQVRMICKEIAAGLSPSQIIEKLLPYIPNINTHLIYDIRSGAQWQHISSEFDFSHMFISSQLHENNSLILDMNFVDGACQVLEKYGRGTSPTKVLELMGINVNELSEKKKKNAFSLICRIKNKERYNKYKEVLEHYDY